MVNIENVTTPSRGRLLIVLGGVLLVLGLVGIGIYTFGGIGAPFDAPAEADGLWQGLLIIVSALLTGVGAVLLVVALIKRSRRGRGRESIPGPPGRL